MGTFVAILLQIYSGVYIPKIVETEYGLTIIKSFQKQTGEILVPIGNYNIVALVLV